MLNGPILALDSDQGSNAVVTYQLLGTSPDLFIINNRTGEVVWQAPVPSPVPPGRSGVCHQTFLLLQVLFQ